MACDRLAGLCSFLAICNDMLLSTIPRNRFFASQRKGPSARPGIQAKVTLWVVKGPDHFPLLQIEPSPSATRDTGSVSLIPSAKRATHVYVPASEDARRGSAHRTH